jgi:hypothetical protein
MSEHTKKQPQDTRQGCRSSRARVMRSSPCSPFRCRCHNESCNSRFNGDEQQQILGGSSHECGDSILVSTGVGCAVDGQCEVYCLTILSLFFCYKHASPPFFATTACSTTLSLLTSFTTCLDTINGTASTMTIPMSSAIIRFGFGEQLVRAAL